MSAIGSFVLLPKSSLAQLRQAATPQKGWFGSVKDRFHEFMQSHGREVASYEGSGYVLATVLPFLQQRGVNLMRSEYDDLSAFLSKERKTTCFILTAAHRRDYLERLSSESYSEAELRDYWNEFNASSEPDVGIPMLDGIRAIRESLGQVDAESIVLLQIG